MNLLTPAPRHFVRRDHRHLVCYSRRGVIARRILEIFEAPRNAILFEIRARIKVLSAVKIQMRISVSMRGCSDRYPLNMQHDCGYNGIIYSYVKYQPRTR